MNVTSQTKRLNDVELTALRKTFKSPTFDRSRCSDWPMCMCQKQCNNEYKPGTQYQLGLA
jgi:hypothetical protein